MSRARGRRGAQSARAGHGRLPALVLLLLGAILLISAVTAIGLARPVSEFGAGEAAQLHRPPAATGEDQRTDGRTLPVDTSLHPVLLDIPAVGLTAQVNPVGVDAGSGEFEVPPQVDQVGWYRYGPGLEASAGSIVIAGHVDGADQGVGAFFRLSDLRRGDLVTLYDGAGDGHDFEVVAREIYDKREIPLARYFARDGDLRLTLITCGGQFDPAQASYRDNVVVTAVPVNR